LGKRAGSTTWRENNALLRILEVEWTVVANKGAVVLVLVVVVVVGEFTEKRKVSNLNDID
jgi:hypothetical protein